MIGNYIKRVKAEQYHHPNQMKITTIRPCVGTHAHPIDNDLAIIQDGHYVIKNPDGSLEFLDEKTFKKQYESIDCSCDSCLEKQNEQ